MRLVNNLELIYLVGISAGYDVLTNVAATSNIRLFGDEWLIGNMFLPHSGFVQKGAESDSAKVVLLYANDAKRQSNLASHISKTLGDISPNLRSHLNVEK